MSAETLQSLLTRLTAYGDRPAVGYRQEYGTRWWSFARLHEKACQVAAWLQARHIPAGAHLVLWAANCPECVSVLLGAVLRGVIVVPIDAAASPDYVARLGAQVKAVLVVHGPDQNASSLDLATLSLYDPWAGETRADEESLRVPVRPDDTAVILFTSGTTAEPKGAILTHRNLISQIHLFERACTITRFLSCRMLCVPPLSHVQGLVLGLCVPLWVGVSVLYIKSADPIHIIQTIRHNRITLLLVVPRVVHLLAKALQEMPYGRGEMTLAERMQPVRFFPLRRHLYFLATHRVLGYSFWVILVGGAALSPKDERFWYESGYVLVQGYGLTETTALVSLKINNPFGEHLGSVGKPLPNQVVKLADDGEVLVQGPNISPGYTSASDSRRDIVEDGFICTGDLALKDARGQLYLLGRKKDIIVTSEGFNVYPQDVEAILAQVQGVREAVVCEREVNGQCSVHAVLLLEPGASSAQIVRQANRVLQSHQRITSWTVWPEPDFPLTRMSKIRRGQVQAAVAAWQSDLSSALEDSTPIPALADILKVEDRDQRLLLLARHLTEVPRENLELEQTHIKDLGLTSLDIVELLTLLERRRDIPLGRVIIPENSSLYDLRRLVHSPEDLLPETTQFRRLPVRMDHPLVALPRTLLMPLVISLWFRLRASLTVSGTERLAGLGSPFIVAGSHHRHGMDAMAVYCALPPALRCKLLLITSQWLFREYLDPKEESSAVWKLVVGTAFHLGMPLLFPFSLWPPHGTTRQGLLETCRLIDRGYCPIVFPENAFFEGGQAVQPGIAVVALQTHAPLVPLRLVGNRFVDFRPHLRREHVTVRFGWPLHFSPNTTIEQVSRRLKAAFEDLENEVDKQAC